MTSGLARRDRWRAAALLRPAAILGSWLVLPARRAVRRVRNPLWPVTAPLLWAALAAVAVIIATMVFVDAWAIEAARRLPAWLVDAFDFLTDFGKAGWFLIPLGMLMIALALAASLTAARLAYLGLTSLALRLWFLFVAIAFPSLVTDVLKLVGRARPFVTGTADPFAYSFFDWRSDYQSFPSGHSTTAFAAVAAFGVLWPGLRPLMWVYAVTIAVSRVVVTAHHPSDVIAGAIVGFLGAILVRNWFAARRLVFFLDGAGRVRPRPLASLRRIGGLVRLVSGRVSLASR